MRLELQTPSVFYPLNKPARYKGIHGGRGCCHPDTLIDTPSGKIKISDFKGGEVYSYHKGKIIKAWATASVEYDVQQLYKVSFANGKSISVTDQHRFLTQRGWVQCSGLSMSDEVVFGQYQGDLSHNHSIAGFYLSMFHANVQSLIEKSLSYLAHCFEDCHQYDLQPHFAINTCQASVPSLNDAQQHKNHVLMRKDGLAFLNKNNSLQSSPRLSIQPVAHARGVRNFVEQGNCTFYKFFEQLSRIFQEFQLFHWKNARFSPIRESFSIFQGIGNQNNLVQSLQKVFGKLRGVFLYNPYKSINNKHNDIILVGISNICKHDRLNYWDLHVPYYENYLSNGIVNHNSGKSHNRAEQLIKRCIQYKTDWVCLREIQKDLSQSVKKLLESKIDKLGVGHLFEVQRSLIKAPHGGLIIFQGMQDHTAESIKSLEGFDGAWFEEAQNMSDRSLSLLRPTIRKDADGKKPASELWFTWNPNQETDPIDRFLRGEAPPDSIVVEANYHDNPFMPEVLKAEMEWDKAHDYGKYEHIWLGKYNVNSDKLVFKNWRVEEFDTHDGALFRLGADWGYSNDPSVLVRCYLIGTTLYIDYEAYMVGCEIVNLPELFMQVPEAERWPITADSARPETISYMQKNGFPKIRAAIKGKRSLEEGVNWLQSYNIVVHPRCKHTIDELKTYSFKVDPLTNEVLSMYEDKDNHVIDAIRYACEGARRAKPQAEPVSYTAPQIPNYWQ